MIYKWKEKLTARGILLFFYCSIFTCMAYFAAWNELYAQRHSILLGALFCVLFLGLAWLFFLFIANYIEDNRTWFVIMIAGVVVRVVYYYLVQPVQVSDFYQPTKFYQYLIQHGAYQEYSVELSALDEFQIYYSLYPAWGVYMLLTHFLYRVLGCHTEIMVFLNILLFMFLFLVTYKLLRKIFLMSTIVDWALLLLAFFPQMVMWTVVTSPDHFTVLGIILLAYVWENKQEIDRHSLLYILLEAICVGFVGLFKPLIALLLLVIICSDGLLNILQRQTKKYIVRELLVTLAIIIVITSSINLISRQILKQYMKTDIQQATSFYILWGYGVDENGNWSDHAADQIFDDAWKDKDTLGDIVAYTNQAAVSMMKDNITLLPRIILQKFKLLFSSENWPSDWGLRNENNQIAVRIKNSRWRDAGLATLNVITLLLLPFSFLKRDKIVIYLSMFWMGYICFLLASGIQTRYRFICLPVQLILASIGYYNLSKRKERISV